MIYKLNKNDYVNLLPLSHYYNIKEFKNTNNLLVEFGDVLFSLICVANSTNIDLEKSLNCALNKYRRRLEDNGKIESGK